MKLYSTEEMCLLLNIKLTSFYQLRFEKNIQPIKKVKNFKYYYKEQFEKEIFRYYPVRTIETFYIYESKLNFN